MNNKHSKTVPIIVKVSKTENIRCERCWRHDETVAAYCCFPEVCSRCAHVLRGLVLREGGSTEQQDAAIDCHKSNNACDIYDSKYCINKWFTVE